MNKSNYLEHRNTEWSKRKISLWGAAWSVIKQLKNGQDLTHVSLPAEFLDPYSALEIGGVRGLQTFPILMDLLTTDDPFHRMMVLLHWFCSGVEQEEFEKKPYNPILGETHRCSVELKNGDVAQYVSEQVTHHPPYSAYFIQNKDRSIEVEANVDFAVHFHGNSISATTSGEAFVTNNRHKEIYVLSKSMADLLVFNVILGTKRMAWLGKIIIDCKETGYKSEMNFLDEGRRNIVKGDIIKNGDIVANFFGFCGEPLTVTDLRDGKKHVFEAKPIKSPIKYPDEQDERESLRVWKDVSKYIVENNLEKADECKVLVEEAQRKRRKEGTDFNPVIFKLNEEKKRWERR